MDMDAATPTLIMKSVKRINTAFFPWSTSVIVPGCCLSYEVVKEEKKEGYEEHVKELDEYEEEIDVTRRSPSPSNPSSEIKILKPYIEEADTFSMKNCHTKCHYDREDQEMIPSPLGPRHSPISTNYDHLIREKRDYHATYYKPNYLQHTSPKSFENIQEPRKHQCEYCFKSFKRSSSLSNHRMIHKNDKTFKCNQCNMCFLRKSDLGKHMVIHSGSKPYQCNVCGKRFSQSSNMLTHQRRHTGIRPYSCTICGKSFYRKVDVRRHASVHRGDYN